MLQLNKPFEVEVLATCRDCGRGVAIFSRGTMIHEEGYAVCGLCDREGRNVIHGYHFDVTTVSRSEDWIRPLHFYQKEPEPSPVLDIQCKTIWELLVDDD